MGDWQPVSNQPPADRGFIAAYFDGEWIYDFARLTGGMRWTHWIDLQPPEPPQDHTKGD